MRVEGVVASLVALARLKKAHLTQVGGRRSKVSRVRGLPPYRGISCEGWHVCVSVPAVMLDLFLHRASFLLKTEALLYASILCCPAHISSDR